MSEKTPPFEKSPAESGPAEPWFAILDIVKIDGRWAQIVGGLRNKNIEGEQLVRYLEDNSTAYINFAEYQLSKIRDTMVADILKAGELSDKQFKNIHWDENNIGTEMSLWVHVFGEFEKKTSGNE